MPWFPRFARLTGRAVTRIAPDLGLQISYVEKDVGLPSQLVGRLIETCADDTVRLTGAAGRRMLLSGGT